MPTKLGDKFSLNWEGSPPGMSVEDFDIWKRYRKTVDMKALGVYFNVYLGDGKDPGESYDLMYRNFWIGKTQLRADTIILFPDRVRIIELRFRASTNVVGRMLAYKKLLEADNPFRLPVEMEVVTNEHAWIVQELCLSLSIMYTVV